MTALGGTDCLFGWVDAYFFPAALSPLPLAIDLSIAAAAAVRAAGNASAAPTGAYRGLWRSGAAPVSNDASADPFGTLGDAFTCPCAAATAAGAGRSADSLVSDPGGANGDAGVGKAVAVVGWAGVLGEPEGVYPHAGVRCTWLLPEGPRTAPATSATLTLASAAPGAVSGGDPPRLLVGPAAGVDTAGSAGQCYPGQCDLLSSGGVIGERKVAVPARVVFVGGSSTTIGKRPAAGGRFRLDFSKSYEPLVDTPGRRAVGSGADGNAVGDGARDPGAPLSWRGVGSDLSNLWSSASPAAAGNSTAHEQGKSVSQPMGGADNSTRSRTRAGTGADGSGSDDLLLALSGAPSTEAPCGFQRRAGQAFLSLSPLAARVTAMEGVWSGNTSVQAAPAGMPMFAPIATGACADQDALARFAVRAPGECASLCVAAAGCSYYSYSSAEAQAAVAAFVAASAATAAQLAAGNVEATAALAVAEGTYSSLQRAAAAKVALKLAIEAAAAAAADAALPTAGDCRLFGSCTLAASKMGYATCSLRGDLADAECRAELSVRGRVLRLLVHCLKGPDASAKDLPTVLGAAASARRSEQSGALSGILRSLPAADLPNLGLARGGGACDALGGPDAPWCNATAAGRVVWYQTARVRWTASASDRVVGSEDIALLAFFRAGSGGDNNPIDPSGDDTELWLFLQPVASGMPNPNAAFDPARRPYDLAAGARRLRLSRAAVTFRVPTIRSTAVISRAASAGQCRSARSALAGLAASGGAGCAKLISALFPVAPGRDPPADHAGAVAAQCGNACLQAATAAIEAAEQQCGAAWGSAPLVPGDLGTDQDGMAVLLASSAPVIDVLAQLAQVSRILQGTLACACL
jgi:hypothetical protein